MSYILDSFIQFALIWTLIALIDKKPNQSWKTAYYNTIGIPLGFLLASLFPIYTALISAFIVILILRLIRYLYLCHQTQAPIKFKETWKQANFGVIIIILTSLAAWLFGSYGDLFNLVIAILCLILSAIISYVLTQYVEKLP